MKKLRSKSSSAVEDIVSCFKDKERYVKDLEDVIEKVVIFHSKKNEISRIVDDAVSKALSSRHICKEKVLECCGLSGQMIYFNYKYNKFINMYNKHCKGPQTETGGSTSSSLEAGKPAVVVTRKLFTLAKLSRDIRSLQVQISVIIDRMNKLIADDRMFTLNTSYALQNLLKKMSMCSIEKVIRPISYSSSSSSTSSYSSSCGELHKHQQQQQCYSILVPEKKHYSFAFKDGNSIELELDDHRIFLVRNVRESSTVINLVEQISEELLPEESEYPNASVLFLQRNNLLVFIGSSFFDSMPDLCFLDLSDTRIRFLPSSLFRLSKLKVLLFRNCISLPDIPPEIEKLSNLEVLDLAGTEQYLLPVQMRRLVRLRHANLSIYGTGSDKGYVNLPRGAMVPQGVLSEFKELESLSITVHASDPRWYTNSALIMKDLVTLEKLSFLQFHFETVELFQDFIRRSRSWANGSLRKFKFAIGHRPGRLFNIVQVEVEPLFDQCNRCLRYTYGYAAHEEIKDVLSHTTAFYLDTHEQVQSLLEFGVSNLKALKFCILRECPKLGVVFENQETDERAFECLEYLGLFGLRKLEHIWRKKTTPHHHVTTLGNFNTLKNLTVSDCRELRFVLEESMLGCVPNLEELSVGGCLSLEITIVKDDDDATKKVASKASVLPRLRIVVLEVLPNLVTLGNGLCPTKQIISIFGCNKLILHSSHHSKKVKRGGLRF